jgi:hypothetical protein
MPVISDMQFSPIHFIVPRYVLTVSDFFLQVAVDMTLRR